MLVRLDVLADGNQKMVLDVGKSSFQEGITCVFDSICDPWLKVEELSFSCQDSQRDSKLVIIPVGQRNKTLLNDLGDI